MIKKIYTQIQEQKHISFEDLFKLNSQEIPTKPELGALLRTLENEKSIFQFAGDYYDLAQFEDVEGYVQWNLTGFCWLSDTNDMNEWGISFNPNDDLLSIYNKREAQYGSFIKGKKVNIEDRTFTVITSSEIKENVKLISVYQEPRKEWVVLNSGTGFSFKTEELNIPHGEVAIFNLLDHKKIEHLGNIKDFGIESKIIELLGEIKKAPKANFTELDNKNLKKVNKSFYTIDSLYTKDIDDAIWIEEDKDNYKLYVAIADVSSYVKPGDAQDLHARQSCSSFYLPHDTIHMLDSQLAENFCSLNPGVSKQAMVCEMLFDKMGKLLEKDFYQAEILSHARLTYSDVDKMINGINPSESLIFKNGIIENYKSLEDNFQIINSLKALENFALTQERKNEKPYWVVEQPEFHIGENGKIDFLYPKEEGETSQKMVESAMLATNIAAAQFVFEKYPQIGMFRNQYKPEENEFPKPAFYDFNNEGHWGLQTDFYTHFTSPIRRYCDLLVHRLIKNIINNEDKLYIQENLQDISKQINLQQYKSKQYAIKAKNLLLPQYIEQLNKDKLFNEKLTVLDYSKDGIVVKNEQLIEMYVPIFKLEKDISKTIEKLVPSDGTEPSIEDKKAGLEKLNSQWNFYMKLVNFIWTDERKTAYYQISRKQNSYQPRTNKN